MNAFRTSTLPILCLLPLALGVLVGCDSSDSGMDGGSVPDQITYDLTAQTDGVSGTVTFWRAGPDSSLVTLNLDGDATLPGVSHPAHIHNNSVSDDENVGIVQDPFNGYLSAVNGSAPNGTSARKIGVPIEELARFNGHVNVHESPANLSNVVAQGNIGANAEGTEGSGLNFVDNPGATTYPLNASRTEGSVLSGGIPGTVRFEELTSSQTLVTYALDTGGSVKNYVGSDVTVAQIGHIHKNTVAESGGIVSGPFSGYLGSVAPTDPAARSSRIINASFDELTSYDGYVNIHQSNANSQYVFAQGNIGANATSGGGGSGADVTVTVTNVGTSAWEVTDVSGASGVAQTGTNNPTLTLKVGTRYRFENNGGTNHPLGFQDGSSSYLLNQDGSGSLEGNSDVNYKEDGEGITFTYAQALADEVATYRCTVHSQMEGDVQTDGGGSGGGGGGGGGGGY